MAKVSKKLIYLLDWNDSGRIHCTFKAATVLNWKSMRPLSIRSLRELLAKTHGLALGPEDQRAVARLIQNESREFTGSVLIGAEGYEVLRQVLDTRRAFLERGNHLRVKWGKPIPAEPTWEVAKNGVAQPVWQLNLPVKTILATAPPCAVVHDGKFDCLRPLQTQWDAAAACSWVGHHFADVDDLESFLRRFVHRHPMINPPKRPGKPLVAGDPTQPVPILRLLRSDATPEVPAMNTLTDLLLVRLEFRYGDRKVRWEEDRKFVATSHKGTTQVVPRQDTFEKECLSRLLSLGLRQKGGRLLDLFNFHAFDFELDPESGADWASLLLESFPSFETDGWELTQDPLLPLRAVEANQLVQKLELEKSGWHTFAANISHNGHQVPVLPLLRDFLRQHRDLDNAALRDLFHSSSFTIPIEDGGEWLVVPGKLLQPLVDTLFELGLQRQLDRSGRLRVSRWRARELAETDPLSGGRKTDPGGLDLQGLCDRLRGGSDPFVPASDPRAAFPELREYQCTGIGWLEFLDNVDAHGILADDMGLGKTFQVLAYLGLRRKTHPGLPPALVVCPTSVMDNWVQETARRAPWLQTGLHHGPRRPRGADALGENIDLFITNYPCLREDVAFLGDLDWDMVILDEAQAIKNAESQTFAAARRLSARRRLCVTGTPLENHLGELWALMHFLMPDYLGSRKQFRDEFVRPIGVGKSSREAQERSRLLANRCSPFILRRTKAFVAPELPERTEINYAVELTPLQAQRYEAIRASMVKDIRAMLKSRTLAASQMHILEALTRLRLLCCDPRIGSHGEPDLSAEHSAKFERLFELLEELMEEGSRILVFSQFVQMLELIETELKRRKWLYRILTGQSSDRREPVKAFQSGEVPLLLLSLKAAGTGLNLTSADAVILYDPWWNPAIERQATDRAHRIGRKDPVFIHRLIAKGTVEEGMLVLQERKRQLIEQVLGGLPGESWTLDAETLFGILGVPIEDGASGGSAYSSDA